MVTLIKYISGFFFSLRTTLWLLGISLVFMFAGAFIMPGQGEFQSLHSTPLFEWIFKQQLKLTWWLWCLIGLLGVLTVNTLFCSIESIMRKKKVTKWLLLIAPQVIHIGFLFILLAHLLSGIGASQKTAAGIEGSYLKLSGEHVLRVRSIDMRLNFYGQIEDWAVTVEYISEGKVLYKDIIRPNNPSVRMGFNINVKDLRPYPSEAVLLQINREPGAIWALTGSILFMVGILVLIVLKIKMER